MARNKAKTQAWAMEAIVLLINCYVVLSLVHVLVLKEDFSTRGVPLIGCNEE